MASGYFSFIIWQAMLLRRIANCSIWLFFMQVLSTIISKPMIGLLFLLLLLSLLLCEQHSVYVLIICFCCKRNYASFQLVFLSKLLPYYFEMFLLPSGILVLTLLVKSNWRWMNILNLGIKLWEKVKLVVRTSYMHLTFTWKLNQTIFCIWQWMKLIWRSLKWMHLLQKNWNNIFRT